MAKRDHDTLREPNGDFQWTIRRLAEAAMSVTHHDIDSREIEAIHEINSMECKFTNILRGKFKSPHPRRPRQERGGKP